jgi:hypothetical protein
VADIHSDEEVAAARPLIELGFVQLVDLGGQNEIVLRQTVDLVRAGRDFIPQASEMSRWCSCASASSPLRFINSIVSQRLENLNVFVMWCSSTMFHPSTCLWGENLRYGSYGYLGADSIEAGTRATRQLRDSFKTERTSLTQLRRL